VRCHRAQADPQLSASYPALTTLSEPLKSVTKLHRSGGGGASKAAAPRAPAARPPPTPATTIPNYASNGLDLVGGALAAATPGAGHAATSLPTLPRPSTTRPPAASHAGANGQDAAAASSNGSAAARSAAYGGAGSASARACSSGMGGSTALVPGAAAAAGGAAGSSTSISELQAMTGTLAKERNERASIESIVHQQKAQIEQLTQQNGWILEELERLRKERAANGGA
jgi:hypothetical protein